ncbi:MAG: CDP-alcohol phosphatidyltransferase family protein [Lachnospiraceae bacterium]|nr:CDP-alcohol phosphatidyltransferase family protein [Lachnospiraceae bacterium]
MIGFYDYTVILTYMGLFSSIFGITQVLDGHGKIALVCLAFSGLCDMFDGKVARSKRNRTDDEKLFGIQIDSLCDLICFGILPIAIGYSHGIRGPLGFIILAYYGVCGLIRLAYFNVLETNKLLVENDGSNCYHGLPITSIAIILPVIYIFKFVVTQKVFTLILAVAMLVVGTMFIVDFSIKKPGKRGNIAMILCGVLAIAYIVVFSRCL